MNIVWKDYSHVHRAQTVNGGVLATIMPRKIGGYTVRIGDWHTDNKWFNMDGELDEIKAVVELLVYAIEGNHGTDPRG